MSSVNSVLIIHTVRIPSGSLAVRKVRDLDLVACGQSGAEHILTGVAGILREQITGRSSPAIHFSDEIETVAIGRLRNGSSCRNRIRTGSSGRDNDRSSRLHGRIISLDGADIIFNGHFCYIAQNKGSVDNGNNAVSVNISRNVLLIGEISHADHVTQNKSSVDCLYLAVVINVAEHVGLGRIGRSNVVVLIDSSYAGRTDLTLDISAGNSELVAGDRINIVAGCQPVSLQANGLGGGAAEVNDHRALSTSLDPSGTAAVGAILALTDEVVVELVDRLGGSVGPRGLSRLTELDAAQRTGAVIIGASKVYGADLRTTRNERPDLTALSRCQAAGSAVHVSIMGLIPEHNVLFGEVGVRIIRDRVAAAGGSSILDLPVVRGVGYVEQLGVHAVRTVNAAGVEDLTVSVDLFIRVSSLNLL